MAWKWLRMPPGGPWYATSPPTRNMAWSKSWKISQLGWWMVHSTERFIRASCLNNETTS